jgi:putative membrane protein insertion efficiency factor
MKHWIMGALVGLLLVFLLIQMGSSGLIGVEMSALHLYQRFGSPVMEYVATCRFTPTCSHYAVEVLEEQGFWKGNLLIVERLVYCSPIGALLGV